MVLNPCDMVGHHEAWNADGPAAGGLRGPEVDPVAAAAASAPGGWRGGGGGGSGGSSSEPKGADGARRFDFVGSGDAAGCSHVLRQVLWGAGGPAAAASVQGTKGGPRWYSSLWHVFGRGAADTKPVAADMDQHGSAPLICVGDAPCPLEGIIMPRVTFVHIVPFVSTHVSSTCQMCFAGSTRYGAHSDVGAFPFCGCSSFVSTWR